jgi:hypothetical protein
VALGYDAWYVCPAGGVIVAGDRRRPVLPRVMRPLALVLALGVAACSRTDKDRDASLATPAFAAIRSPADSSFARLIDRLSEPPGFFDSDNLVSNEPSYLTVLGKMAQMRVRGGAYLGVGPDQSFSYIAQVRPKIAFMIDIRRDNLLQHLLYKALFATARNRVEYLALLFGRPVPQNLDAWKGKSIGELVQYVDSTAPRQELFDATQRAIAERVRLFGLALTDSDLATISRIHASFFDEGLDLRYTSLGRPSRPNYPSYRDLLLEHDLAGRQANYFAREEDWQFLKEMEDQNLIVPVTGNLAGDKALRAIGKYMSEHDLTVSAFYVSNVESYLMRDGSFDRFAENVSHLPIDERSVFIRSYFGGRSPFPAGYAGSGSYYGSGTNQILQTVESFVTEWKAGGYLNYLDVVVKHAIDLR